MECLTEAAICSQLANRDLFGQWAQPSTQQTSAFLLVHSRKNQTPAALLSDSNTTFGQAFKTKCLCPTVTIQWVPTAFLEAMSVYSQLHSQLVPKFICKGREKKVMGKSPISIYNNRQGKEWLNGFVLISKNSSGKGIKCKGNLMGFLSPPPMHWGVWMLLPPGSGRTPSVIFQRKPEKRWGNSDSKDSAGVCEWYNLQRVFQIVFILFLKNYQIGGLER